MRVTIVGAGAVGGLLGAMLARSGTEVTFVARGPTRERIARAGIRLSGPGGISDVGPFVAEEDPAKLPAADGVIVAVKSWQLQAIAPRLAPLVGPATVVASLQNGVEAADTLIQALGEAAVIGGLCHVLASSEAPGQVCVRGAPLRVTLGELGGGSSPRVETLAATLRTAGVTVAVSGDIRAAIWEKLLFVGPMGMIGAATGMAVDHFRCIPASRRLLVEAMAEVRSVALSHGIRVPEEATAAALERLDALPDGSKASMQRDLEAGRHSELEEQVGAVVRLATRAGLDVPVHRVLYAALAARAELAAGTQPATSP
jgi:2-dehydropantoate 2-reductase